MKFTSIKSHLRPYSIYGRRSTTINHAFASAIAPTDIYEESRVREALIALGQDPDDLTCVFGGERAETWDHLVGLVRNKLPYGYGHQLGNLIPSCRDDNSEKGSRDWQEFLQARTASTEEYEAKRVQIQNYLDAYAVPVDLERMRAAHPEDWGRFYEIRDQIFALMREADEIATRLRQVRE
jgi:hypothetical protein